MTVCQLKPFRPSHCIKLRMHNYIMIVFTKLIIQCYIMISIKYVDGSTPWLQWGQISFYMERFADWSGVNLKLSKIWDNMGKNYHLYHVIYFFVLLFISNSDFVSQQRLDNYERVMLFLVGTICPLFSYCDIAANMHPPQLHKIKEHIFNAFHSKGG